MTWNKHIYDWVMTAASPGHRELVVQVDNEDTQEKRNATLASVSPQHWLHAAKADAVTLGQRTMRGARVAAPNNLEDYLLTFEPARGTAKTRCREVRIDQRR